VGTVGFRKKNLPVLLQGTILNKLSKCTTNINSDNALSVLREHASQQVQGGSDSHKLTCSGQTRRPNSERTFYSGEVIQQNYPPFTSVPKDSLPRPLYAFAGRLLISQLSKLGPWCSTQPPHPPSRPQERRVNAPLLMTTLRCNIQGSIC
jgi:hypothetical protein